MLRPSKPCVYEITGGAVACRFCGAGKARVAVVKGWVPLYRRLDGLACCVPVDECQRDHLDSLKCFTKVTVGREKGKGVGVWVRSCMNQEPEWSSTLEERTRPADITESLITMWALPEVTGYFGRGASGDNGVSLDAATNQPATVPAPVADRMSAGPAVDGAVKRLLDHAKKAERNGNGAH